MTSGVQWDPAFSVGHEVIDAQHRQLLEQCNALGAGNAPEGSAASAGAFEQALASLRALAREHFETEAAWLADLGHADLDEHRAERDEFEYQLAEIATPGNFDRAELQRFLALWWLGHVAGAREQYGVASG